MQTTDAIIVTIRCAADAGPEALDALAGILRESRRPLFAKVATFRACALTAKAEGRGADAALWSGRAISALTEAMTDAAA